jgi:hypothetical protein
MFPLRAFELSVPTVIGNLFHAQEASARRVVSGLPGGRNRRLPEDERKAHCNQETSPFHRWPSQIVKSRRLTARSGEPTILPDPHLTTAEAIGLNLPEREERISWFFVYTTND